MNKVFLSGNLTRNFEIKYAPNGKAYARAGIAVNRFDKGVDFFNIVAFGKTAEFCDKYLEEGRRVLIEGKLQTSSYTDNNGFKRIDYSVIVDNIEFADSKKKAQPETPPTADNPDDAELPF